MRIAILSDIHGNSIALDAVLEDIHAQGGVDAYWVVGDLVAIGPDPTGVMDRLARLPDATFVRGNTDRMTTSDFTDELVKEAKTSPDEVAGLLGVGQSFAWTRGAVACTGWLDWLAALPTEQRLTLPDGTRLLAAHASPGKDDGAGFHPRLNELQMREALAGCSADLVVVGHTHVVMNLHIGEIHVINLGSVSNPPVPDPSKPDLRASYVILDAHEKGYTFEDKRVDYDHAAVIDMAKRRMHPAEDYITRFMLGQITPGWMKS